MPGFIIRTQDNETIRFEYYAEAAPVTCAAFAELLPFTRTFLHARVSGREIWTDDAPALDIIQENASVFTAPGEIVFGPVRPERNKIIRCMGIFYGAGKLQDCGNIFGKVAGEDRNKLETLGNSIWKNGQQELSFEAL